MALVPTLTLTDSTSFSDEISFSVTDSLTIGSPAQSLTKTASESSTGSPVTILAASVAGNKYFFIKHTGKQSDGSSTASGDLIIRINSTDVIRLASEEFAFFPVKASLAIDIQSNDSNTILAEYAYWTKG